MAQSGGEPSNTAQRPRISRHSKIGLSPSMARTMSSTLISSAGRASLKPPRTPSVATTSLAFASLVNTLASSSWGTPCSSASVRTLDSRPSPRSSTR
ncbi:hypothetical protein D3C80_1855210 [compost metagenome]